MLALYSSSHQKGLNFSATLLWCCEKSLVMLRKGTALPLTSEEKHWLLVFLVLIFLQRKKLEMPQITIFKIPLITIFICRLICFYWKSFYWLIIDVSDFIVEVVILWRYIKIGTKYFNCARELVLGSGSVRVEISQTRRALSMPILIKNENIQTTVKWATL